MKPIHIIVIVLIILIGYYLYASKQGFMSSDGISNDKGFMNTSGDGYNLTYNSPSYGNVYYPGYDGHLETTPFVPPPIGEGKFEVTTISGPPAGNYLTEYNPPTISQYKVSDIYGTHQTIMEDIILAQ